MSEPLVEKYFESRHQYILRRRESLNEATFKIFAIYQAAFAALIAAQFLILREFEARAVSAGLAKLASEVVLALVLVSTFSYLLLSIGGIFAWLGYRREELAIEEYYGVPSRGLPRWQDVFKWFEFYLLLIALALGLCTSLAYVQFVFPRFVVCL